MKQSFQESDLAGYEEALHKLLRTTGNLAFVPLAAALAGSIVLTSRVRIRLWHAFLLTHLVHIAALIALRQRHSHTPSTFSLVSKTAGPLGYAVVAALTLAQLPPGPPPKRGWRRPLQRAGHNVLLGIHAFTIGHGYQAKGKRTAIYGPLAALWVAAAVGVDRAWRAG